jgi:hypothetical protein
MKKIMSMMLGLSLVLGAAAVYAQDKPADATKTEKKHKKGKKKKAADTTEKKS